MRLIQHNPQTVGFEWNNQVQPQVDPYLLIDKIYILAKSDMDKIHTQKKNLGQDLYSVEIISRRSRLIQNKKLTILIWYDLNPANTGYN